MTRGGEPNQKVKGGIAKLGCIPGLDWMNKDSFGVIVLANQNILIAATRGDRITACEVRVSGAGMFRVEHKVDLMGLGFSGG